MDEALNSIPPEAWPLINYLFNATMVLTMLWLGYSLIVGMRRSASNLTPVHSVSAKKKAQPDFLSTDHKARNEALKRGDDFDKELSHDERIEERNARRQRQKETSVGRIGRLVTLGMALFSLATMVSGTIFQVSIMGRYWEQFSAQERLVSVVTKHPIGVAITAGVIIYNFYIFFKNRKWEAE